MVLQHLSTYPHRRTAGAPVASLPMIRKLAVFYLLLPMTAATAAETVLEVGPAFMFRRPGIGMAAVWTERVGGWDVGMMFVSPQHLHGQKLSANAGLRLARSVRCGRAELGLGLGYWAHSSDSFGHRQVFELTAGWHVSSRVALRFRHYSNAGQATPNVGQNMVTASWSFQ